MSVNSATSRVGGAETQDSSNSKKSPAPPGVMPQFVDVAADSGISFTLFNDAIPNRYYLPEVMGGGVGWFDFDLDDQQDLFLANGTQLENPDPMQMENISRLYQNRGGRFVDVTISSHLWHNGYGQGIAIADYDADGFPDVYQTCFGPNVLFHNNGDGTFTNVTDQAQVGDELWGTSALWLDVNDDLLLDLFVVNYLLVNRSNLQICEYGGKPGYCGPGTYEAAPDRVYVNLGDGHFSEQSEVLGLTAERGKGLAILAADFDDDLRPEIYVGNDMVENFLFTKSLTHRDHGNPSTTLYANVATFAGCAVSDVGLHEANMGIACTDFDGDRRFDIYITHYYAEKNTLYRNLGNLVFVDDSRRTRVAATSWESLGFGTVAFDYDRDRRDDFFVTNGHVLGPFNSPNEMTPQLLHNDRGKFVEDVSSFAGDYFRELWLGRGAAGGDFDNDGDLDLAVTHLFRPFALLRNDTKTNRHFIGFDLRTTDRVTPVGAKILVSGGGTTTATPVTAGGSYLSDHDDRILIGLADQITVDVQVRWPEGLEETYRALAADRYWRLTPGAQPQAVDPTPQVAR